MGATTVKARSSVTARAPKSILRLRGDDELVSRCRNGDERAFELLYERHLPGILAFCRHMLADSAEAEDAVQHTFTAAYRELVDSDRPLRLKAWLYTVARNRCLSLLRDRRERPRAEVEPSTEGLQEVVQQRADLREMLADLHDLPPDQRAALVLAELEDLSHEEIATVIDCPVTSVKGLVFRARAGLLERQEARHAACSDIRMELAAARRGGLRRGRLKHHLRACPDCAAYLTGLKRQRRMLALVLPVAPTAGLKPGLLASLGVGGGAAAGGLAAAGTAGTAAALAVAAAVGGAGLAGQGPLASQSSGDGRVAPPARKAPAPLRADDAAARAVRPAIGAPARSRPSRAGTRTGGRADVPSKGRAVRARGFGNSTGKLAKPPKSKVGQRGSAGKTRPAKPVPAPVARGNGGARNGAIPPGQVEVPGSATVPKVNGRSGELPAAAEDVGKKPK